MRVILSALIFFSPGSAWAMGHAPEQPAESALIGKPAPDAVLARSDGAPGSVVGSFQGHRTILVFWATWCPHCYEDLGQIYAGLASIEQKGIKVILVDVGETPQDVKNYFASRQMKLASFVDEDSVMQRPYRLIGVPTLIFIDEKGTVRNVAHEFPSNYTDYFSS